MVRAADSRAGPGGCSFCLMELCFVAFVGRFSSKPGHHLSGHNFFRILSSCFSISLASCTCFLLCLARLSEAFCFNLFACQLGAFSLHAHCVLS